MQLFHFHLGLENSFYMIIYVTGGFTNNNASPSSRSSRWWSLSACMANYKAVILRNCWENSSLCTNYYPAIIQVLGARIRTLHYLLGAGGAGSPEKNVAPSCLEIGLGFRWWLVEVRLDTVYPWVDCKLPSVRCSLVAGSPPPPSLPTLAGDPSRG